MLDSLPPLMSPSLPPICTRISNENDGSKSGGLSPGLIAGIVLGLLGSVGAGGTVVWLVLRALKRQHPTTGHVVFVNAAHTVPEPISDTNSGALSAVEPISDTNSGKLSDVASVAVGARCNVAGIGVGTVCYVGQVQNRGLRVGVWLDDPTGMNDGTAFGHRYFECPDGHGLFATPDRVTEMKTDENLF